MTFDKRYEDGGFIGFTCECGKDHSMNYEDRYFIECSCGRKYQGKWDVDVWEVKEELIEKHEILCPICGTTKMVKQGEIEYIKHETNCIAAYTPTSTGR